MIGVCHNSMPHRSLHYERVWRLRSLCYSTFVRDGVLMRRYLARRKAVELVELGDKTHPLHVKNYTDMHGCMRLHIRVDLDGSMMGGTFLFFSLVVFARFLLLLLRGEQFMVLCSLLLVMFCTMFCAFRLFRTWIPFMG
eukprot:TRINITY_DN1561_c1_g1_i1.p1 TRINITY_DN1561_c1_g1~~TRINITY_DN1561_c1_g1_i1.p1  ORF type:complete len:139 (-),score=23.39 TRINITY_DN1561_c1_g1_i1:37-453(-)